MDLTGQKKLLKRLSRQNIKYANNILKLDPDTDAPPKFEKQVSQHEKKVIKAGQRIGKLIGKLDALAAKVDAAKAPANFAGTWLSDESGNTFINQDSDGIINGTWDAFGGGSFGGKVTGRVATGQWSSNGEKGPFTITMLKGNKTFSGDCYGPWTGTRISN